MDAILQYFGNDQLAKTLGIELIEFGPGRAKCKMLLEKKHLNGLNKAHGGSLFSLADFTFAVAANSHGTVAVAISTNMSFVKAVDPGVMLYAEAVEETRNPKIATYSVKITDETGDIVALFSGMVYRKKNLISEYVKKAE